MHQATGTISFWQQGEWTVAFISSIVTILFTLVIRAITSYFRKKRLRQEMARNFSIEIFTNKEKYFGYLKNLERLRDTFGNIIKLDGGRFSGYANFMTTGKATTVFFDAYKEQLILFHVNLMIDIYVFYTNYLFSV